MKRYLGVEVQLHSFFDLGTRWRWVVSFTPRPLYPQGKNPWYPLDMRLGGPQSRSGRGGEEKNSQPPPGIEPSNRDRPDCSPALYRLSYHGSSGDMFPSKAFVCRMRWYIKPDILTETIFLLLVVACIQLTVSGHWVVEILYRAEQYRNSRKFHKWLLLFSFP
jgi:hypothetical protein